MFGIGPAYLFVLQYRLPIGLMRAAGKPWFSTMATNAAIAVLVAAMMWLVGVGQFLLVQLPITLTVGLGRRLAVLCPAPVRAYFLGPGPDLEPAPCRAPRQLALRAARRAALVHRQHRQSTTSTISAPDSVVSAAEGAARLPGAFGTVSRITLWQSLPMRAAGAVG